MKKESEKDVKPTKEKEVNPKLSESPATNTGGPGTPDPEAPGT